MNSHMKKRWITVAIVLVCALALWLYISSIISRDIAAYYFERRHPREAEMQASTEKDGLDDTCESFIGELLLVNPVYGWGWAGNEEAPNPPGPFSLRLEHLWWHAGIRRGGVGMIADVGHRYNGFSAIFNLRHVGTFNFTTKPGHYNIVITSSPIAEPNGWPLPADKQQTCAGFAEIKVCQ